MICNATLILVACYENSLCAILLGMQLCSFTSTLSCFYTFWHAIPTFLNLFSMFWFSCFNILFDIIFSYSEYFTVYSSVTTPHATLEENNNCYCAPQYKLSSLDLSPSPLWTEGLNYCMSSQYDTFICNMLADVLACVVCIWVSVEVRWLLSTMDR